MNLPFDVARCPNDDCHLKENCLRWLSPGNLNRQVFTAFPVPEDGKPCENQIPVSEERS